MLTSLRSRARHFLGPAPSSQGSPLFWMLTLTIGALAMIGLVMVLSASSVMALSNHRSAWYIFQRQSIWALLGVIAFLLMARTDYHRWQKLAPVLLGGAMATMALVLVPGIGRTALGARRWIGLNTTFGFQPSQLAKFALLVFGAHLLSRRVDRLGDRRYALYPMVAICTAFGLLALLEPDLDAAMEISLVAFAVMWAAGIPWKQLACLVAAEVAAVGVLAVVAPYRLGRLLTFLDPGRDPLNKSYQITQSLTAIGSGGWTGLGLGNGHAKWSFLPFAHTDFIFAIIGEELGFLGCLLVLGLFAIFTVIGCKIALRAGDRFGMLIAAGLTAWVAGQAMLNIAMVVGLAPVTGTPLPFISAGGSSLVILMGATGLLANVARQCVVPKPVRVASHPALRSRTNHDRVTRRPATT
jgi:cell division protein FtsW